MILTELNTDYVKEGAESKEELLSCGKVLLYRTDSLISSVSYAGTADKINKSTSIPKEFKEILTNIQGYVSLGSTRSYVDYRDGKEPQKKSVYRNVHVYSSKATTLDGLQRICHISSLNDDMIQVSEYSPNRGASYSSLYLILKNKLINNGFIKNIPDDSFNISLKQLPKLVEILNQIIKENEDNKYALEKSDKIDTINSGSKGAKKKLFYNVAYWTEKKSEEKQQSNVDITNTDDILNMLTKLVPRIEFIDNISDMESILKKIDLLTKVSNAKKTILEVKKEIDNR